MATFIHLTRVDNIARIRRRGLAAKPAYLHEKNIVKGVFAVPVTPDFYSTHQWLRELRRSGSETIAGVILRIPDLEQVWVGRYGQAKEFTTAVQAVAVFLQEERLGWEVIVPRRVLPKKISKVVMLSQAIGWRFSPEAKGKPLFCNCDFCLRGQRNSQRLRNPQQKTVQNQPRDSGE